MKFKKNHFFTTVACLILLFSIQGCATKQVLINPYQEPDPAIARVARVRLVGAGTGFFRATVYKNTEKSNCMRARDGADIGVFVMEFMVEKSTKLIGMPELSAWAKRIGSEYYFKAGEPLVIGANWGSSSTSYTGVGFSTSSYSCVLATGFTLEEKKDYELNFTLRDGSNGKLYCVAILSDIQPDPKIEGKFVGVDVPVQRVELYGSDEEVTSKCSKRDSQ